MVTFGLQQRGVDADPRFKRTEGVGFVAAKDGQYRDAIQKKHCVLLLVTEPTGAISASLMGVLRGLGAQAKEKGALDATAYGTARAVDQRLRYTTHHTGPPSQQLFSSLTRSPSRMPQHPSNSPCLTCK